MQDKRTLIGRVFLGVSVTGSLFVLTETVLQSFGKSICAAVGCRLVAQSARFGDVSILLIGLLTFSLLSVLSFKSLYRNKPAFEKYINLVLIVSLACEGFFTGYQAFRLYTPCTFCLMVFGLLVALGALRLLSGEKEVIAGFAAMAAVFSLFYLILPAEGTARIPEQERLVLFYSKDCKYCTEVMKEVEENKIPVNHVLVNGYASLLKSMGIEHVPTLYVKDNNERIFLIGKDSIEGYLFSPAQGGKTIKTPAKASAPPMKANRPAEQGSFSTATGPGNRLEQSLTPTLPSSEEGMCKKNEECK